jgi:ADP-heptose:LPS heptosyltransferase
MGARIIVLKLGAIGDALRTTPILSALARAHPIQHITWVTDHQSIPILSGNPLIDILLTTDPKEISIILPQQFDILLSLDKALPTISLAMQLNARIRRGYAMSPWGTLDIFNESARYSLALGLDDDLKFRINEKTYQQTIYEIAELPYQRDPYIYDLTEEARSAGADVIRDSGGSLEGLKIGLNTGCGDVFATKKWPDAHFIQLAQLIHQHLNAQVFLLGGPAEQESNRVMMEKLRGAALNTGLNPLGTFAGILSHMDIIVTSDSMALHLGLAVGSRAIGLFGPTCSREIDYYNHGRSLIGIADCSPCYRTKCIYPESCMAKIRPEEVLAAIAEFLPGVA